MRVHVLGSGTSTGVPVCGCMCPVCTSANPKNTRLRTSVYIEQGGSAENAKDAKMGIVVDTGPDFRFQCLRAGILRIDAVLYTHAHADHICGIDDLRCYNFLHTKAIPVYALKETSDELLSRFKYCFVAQPNYEGSAPPELSLNTLTPYEERDIAGFPVTTIPVTHGSGSVAAFRIGNFAYVTDCSAISEKSRDFLRNLDVLILDGLRSRPHRTHFTQAQAVAEVEALRPKKTYLTHISHELDHNLANEQLKNLSSLDIELAYDGLIIPF